jgi:hypothetical protein
VGFWAGLEGGHQTPAAASVAASRCIFPFLAVGIAGKDWIAPELPRKAARRSAMAVGKLVRITE